MMRTRGTVLAALAGAGLLGGAIAAESGAASPRGTTSVSCTKASNIEAIVDDSGSMSSTDPNRLRVQALDLLINALSSGTNLGAVEFGGSFDPSTPSADVVFPAEPVGANAAAMKSALDSKIQADNGATDYNAAFNTARAANPGAKARIFLTDGGHDVGDYNNAHLNPPPSAQTPTYVVGFSPGVSGGEDQARLQKIASDTGGHYYPLPDSSALQSVMNSIETTLTCQTPPQTFTDALRQGRSKTHSVTIGAKTKSLQIALTWASPLDQFTISHLRLVSHGKTIAVASRRHRPRRLKVTRRSSTTFTVLKVSHLRKGKLKFRLKAKRIGSGQPKVTLTTQVSRPRRR